MEYLEYHGVKLIDTAALLSKPWAEIQPDFVAKESEAWVIFPNEIRETIELLTEIWQEHGDTEPVIKQQIASIGFSENEVAMFCHLK
jgi:hypothetical protein